MGTALPQLCRWQWRSRIEHAAVCSLTNVATQREHINNHVLAARAELHEAAEALHSGGKAGTAAAFSRTAWACLSGALQRSATAMPQHPLEQIKAVLLPQGT